MTSPAPSPDTPLRLKDAADFGKAPWPFSDEVEE